MMYRNGLRDWARPWNIRLIGWAIGFPFTLAQSLAAGCASAFLQTREDIRDTVDEYHTNKAP